MIHIHYWFFNFLTNFSSFFTTKKTPPYLPTAKETQQPTKWKFTRHEAQPTTTNATTTPSNKNLQPTKAIGEFTRSNLLFFAIVPVALHVPMVHFIFEHSGMGFQPGAS